MGHGFMKEMGGGQREDEPSGKALREDAPLGLSPGPGRHCLV